VGDYARDGQSRVLEPGMVFTVEPGLYFGGSCEDGTGRFAGIGVRVEDDVLVTADGCENLTAALTTDADRLAELVGRGR
jgi:Xaa-Pro aminopeptidase